MAKRFITPFAQLGDRDSIPNEPSGNEVNYQTGYTAPYESNPETDPDAKFVERDKTNQLFNDITANIKHWQERTYPEFIDAASNNGAFEYSYGDVVYFNGSLYKSLYNSNTDSPTTSKWELFLLAIPPFNTVSEMTSADYLSSLPSGTRVEWNGYYSQADGGGNWGVLRFGDHTEDGGSIFSIDSTTYIEANISGAVDVLKFGVVGDGSTDDTSIIQYVIDNYVDVRFPYNRQFSVSQISFNTNGAVYSGNVNVIGNAASSVKSVVEITGRQITFERLKVDQNFNTNYDCALHWYSKSNSAPAQYNKIKELALINCIYGLLFGQFFGDTVIDAPQSENSIAHFNTRGCQVPVYMNQTNGFLFISDSTINSIRNEWELTNPGVYSYEDAKAIVMHKGNLLVTGGEILKTDTQLGTGVDIHDGTLKLSNVSIEIACPNYYVYGGTTKMSNITSLMSNASADYIEIDENATGSLSISNCGFRKPTSATNANRGFIKHNSNETMNVKVQNVDLENFLTNAIFKDADNKDAIPYRMQITNLSSNDDDGSRIDMYMSSNRGFSTLDNVGVDTSCSSDAGWFLDVAYGSGTTLSPVSDAPTIKGVNISSSLELVATGEAFATTLNTDSLADSASTGVAVYEGKQIIVSGWFKASATGSQMEIGIYYSDSTGVANGFKTTSNPPTIGTDWRYIETIVKVPAGAKWAGFGVRSVTSSVRFTDVKLKTVS